MRLVFFQPDIPQNVGAAMRLAACFGAGMDIIEPCAFPLTDRGIRKAAMDYSAQIAPVRHASWIDYVRGDEAQSGRLVLLTTRAEQAVWDFDFAPEDRILLGRESAGVTDEVHEAADARLLIPIRPETRSLNVVSAAAIALGEAVRQTRTG